MNRKVECYRIQVEKGTENKFLEDYTWRIKTSLPIVKTFYTNVLPGKGCLANVEIFIEHCPKRLTNFHDIPLSQGFYLMKEALYGFERLWQKFGEF